MKKRKKVYKRIVPLRKKCDCGKRVLNHHWLCDKCWGLKCKRAYHQKRKKLLQKNL